MCNHESNGAWWLFSGAGCDQWSRRSAAAEVFAAQSSSLIGPALWRDHIWEERRVTYFLSEPNVHCSSSALRKKAANHLINIAFLKLRYIIFILKHEALNKNKTLMLLEKNAFCHSPGSSTAFVTSVLFWREVWGLFLTRCGIRLGKLILWFFSASHRRLWAACVLAKAIRHCSLQNRFCVQKPLRHIFFSLVSKNRLAVNP